MWPPIVCDFVVVVFCVPSDMPGYYLHQAMTVSFHIRCNYFNPLFRHCIIWASHMVIKQPTDRHTRVEVLFYGYCHAGIYEMKLIRAVFEWHCLSPDTFPTLWCKHSRSIGIVYTACYGALSCSCFTLFFVSTAKLDFVIWKEILWQVVEVEECGQAGIPLIKARCISCITCEVRTIVSFFASLSPLKSSNVGRICIPWGQSDCSVAYACLCTYLSWARAVEDTTISVSGEDTLHRQR
jgi:hypothetical protein